MEENEFNRGLELGATIMQILYDDSLKRPRKCKYCGSYKIRRFGRSKDTGQQRLQCKDCSRTFMDTDSLPGMKTPADQVASALNMYYEGILSGLSVARALPDQSVTGGSLRWPLLPLCTRNGSA